MADQEVRIVWAGGSLLDFICDMLETHAVDEQGCMSLERAAQIALVSTREHDWDVLKALRDNAEPLPAGADAVFAYEYALNQAMSRLGAQPD